MENQTITEVVTNNERLTNLQLDLLNKHGLAWSVIEEPLFSQSGLPTTNIGLFRSDNNAHIGTHTSRYNTCQNAELAKLLVYACSPIADLNLEGSRGGEFFGGRKIFFQIPLPNTEIGTTKVNRYLTALNSFDGSTAVALGSCQTVVVCQNTFWKAYRSSDISKVGHYATMKSKLESLTEQIHFAMEKDEEQVAIFNKMYEIEINDSDIKFLTHKIFNVMDEHNIGTRKENRMAKFQNDLQLEFAEQGKNAWGLFNGVTRYTNHSIKENQSFNGKMANVICGTGAKINSLAFEHLTKRFDLISKN